LNFFLATQTSVFEERSFFEGPFAIEFVFGGSYINLIAGTKCENQEREEVYFRVY